MIRTPPKQRKAESVGKITEVINDQLTDPRESAGSECFVQDELCTNSQSIDTSPMVLQMSPDICLDEQPQRQSKTKSKSSTALKADKPLPAFASSVHDLGSYSTLVNLLTTSIIHAVGENRSVTTINKKFIITASSEIRKATENFLKILSLSEAQPSDKSDPPPPPSPPSHNNVTLKEELVTVMREEMNKLKSELQSDIIAKRDVTYAQILTNNNSNKSSSSAKAVKSTYKPAIVVTSREEVASKKDTINNFKKSITFRNKNYAPVRVQSISKNKLRVEFQNQVQCEETLANLKDSETITAEPAKKLRPMLILKGVSNDIPIEELTDIIKQQNYTIGKLVITEDDLKFKFKRNNNKNSYLYNAVFIVSPVIWHEATHLGRLNVDHQKVFVGDFSPFIQCYRCLQFGHISKSCTSDCQPCAYCADSEHQVSSCPHATCKIKKPNCYNCVKYNNTSKTDNKIDTHHIATSTNCPTVKYMQNQIKNKIDYGY